MATKKKTRKKTATRRGAGSAPAKSDNPAFNYLLGYMQKNPQAAYADAAAAAEKAGHKVYPIMWGRAQVVLGRVKSKPRGQGKAKTAAAAAAAGSDNGRKKVGKRGPGRPRKDESAAAPAPARRGPGRPRKTAAPAEGLPVEAAHLQAAGGLVDALNAGGKAVLRYDGGEWALAVE